MAEPQMMPLLRTGLYVDFRVLNEKQAMSNHGQTLEQLAARGGLGPAEALAIAEGRAWHAVQFNNALLALSALAMAKPTGAAA